MCEKRQIEVLSSLDDDVSRLHQQHLNGQKSLWMPTELLAHDHVPPKIPPELLSMLVLNLLTEEGLPYFFGLLVVHLGDKGALWKWTRQWTAEEDRHGAVLNTYVSRALGPRMVEVERLQTRYILAGFWPDWGRNPYRLLAYVVLQEYATQISHRNLAKEVKEVDQVLARVLGTVAGEEGKHHAFYLALFKLVLSSDRSRALVALYETARSFAMPGGSMPQFEDLAYLQTRREIFSPKHLSEIVSKTIRDLEIETINGLDDKADEARGKLVKLPSLITRIGESMIRRNQQRKLSFPFLPDVEIVV